MIKDMNINVHHLTRVEGHGNIVVNVSKGTIEKCEWQVPEAPRFFEAMIRGRHYSEVARITSRICGICSVGHTLASVKATENALGINETPQTWKLRNILKHAENFDSHALHVFVLVTPDLLGAPSIFPLVKTHGDVIAAVLRVKRFAHEWGSILAGRTTHPTKVIPGGFSIIPSADDLRLIKKKIVERVADINACVEVAVSIAGKIPAFDRPTEYMAVSHDKEYGLYDGCVQTVMPDGTKQRYPVSDYLKITNEYISPQSTAKWTKNKMESYAAGALARFNNHYSQLHPEAKKLAERINFKPLVTNPYMNSVAQLIEMVHSVYETLRFIDELLAEGVNVKEPLQKPTKHGIGYGATEVPRGILFHSYTYDQNYMATKGDCIIPTNQNHANIQKDFEKLLPELLAQGKSEKEIELAMSMLVRAYDPCISCSTHMLDVKFVK